MSRTYRPSSLKSWNRSLEAAQRELDAAVARMEPPESHPEPGIVVAALVTLLVGAVLLALFIASAAMMLRSVLLLTGVIG